MKRACDICGERYEAQRRTSKFCSARCRVRNASRPKPDAPDAPAQPVAGGLYTRALLDYVELGVADSTSAQLALGLAARLDSPTASDASRAPLARQFAIVHAGLVGSVEDPNDPVEVLRARVRARHAGLLD
jgi:hypothetical protein